MPSSSCRGRGSWSWSFMSSFETVVVVWSVVVVVVVVVVAVVPRDGCPELRSSTIPRFWTQGKVTPKVKGCAPRGQHLWNGELGRESRAGPRSRRPQT